MTVLVGGGGMDILGNDRGSAVRQSRGDLQIQVAVDMTGKEAADYIGATVIRRYTAMVAPSLLLPPAIAPSQ